MWIGRFQAGEEIAIPLLTTDSDGDPAFPDEPPTVHVYSSTAPVLSKRMPVCDRPPNTGFFLAPLFLAVPFEAGFYTAIVRWKISSFHGAQLVRFEVLPGGDGSGQVISMYGYERPNADFVLQQRSSGRIYRGRNPRR